MTDLFLSSNGYGNDYLKSGPRWSEQPGPPQTSFVMMNPEPSEYLEEYHERSRIATASAMRLIWALKPVRKTSTLF